MRKFLLAVLFCVVGASSLAFADDGTILSADEMKAIVKEVTQAQNKMMMRGSTVADVDALFAYYPEDFVYVHEVYGGVYTRKSLYRNAAKYAASGHYRMEQDRYQIVQMIAGHQAVAVQRLELASGKHHLTVFEFKGKKLAKILEYWK